MIRPRPLLLVLALAAVAPSAAAQAIDPVAATELFRQGREAMAAKDWKTAAQRLTESTRLDAKVGTLINLAECQDNLGQIASARQHLQRAIDLAAAQRDDRLDLAKTRFVALDKRVPRLTVVLAPAVKGARVRRDDVDLGAGSLGARLPVEPGKHVVTVSADGRADRTFDVTLAEGAHLSLEVDVGAALPSDAQPSRETEEQGAPASGSGMRTTGFVVVGVGIAGLAVGSVFALMAINENAESKQSCVENVCDQTGKDLRDDARAAGNVATVGFIVGGVALAAGAAMIIFSPSNKTKAVTVSPYGGGLLVSGAF